MICEGQSLACKCYQCTFYFDGCATTTTSSTASAAVSAQSRVHQINIHEINQFAASQHSKVRKQPKKAEQLDETKLDLSDVQQFEDIMTKASLLSDPDNVAISCRCNEMYIANKWDQFVICPYGCKYEICIKVSISLS
jgi:hypothetical protein